MAREPQDWREEVVNPAVIRAAKALTPWIADRFYLAGGTALALQAGHRISLDLDFFSGRETLDARARTKIEAGLRDAAANAFQIRESEDRTCHYQVHRISVSLFHYPYPVLEPFKDWRGLPVASIADIAPMKLGAALGRGARKDFIDLHWIALDRGLDFIFATAKKKFPERRDFLLQAAKALTYFDDAEGEPMPKMLQTVKWEQVKAYFLKEVPRYVRAHLE